jgi:hypothetical protein
VLGRSQLDEATHSGAWSVKVYPGAREAVAFVPARPLADRFDDVPSYGSDHYEDAGTAVAQSFDALDALAVVEDVETEDEAAARVRRNRENAGRRAKSRARRYCKANALTRLWTLTFAEAVHERADVVAALNGLSRALRAKFGESFPYLWVIEEHESGALHVHIAASRLMAMRCRRCDPKHEGRGLHADDVRGRLVCLPCTWGHGFVMTQRFKGQKGNKAAAVRVASYVSKYVVKDVEAVDNAGKSYDVARGYKPAEVVFDVEGPARDALAVAAGVFFDGDAPSFVWSSENVGDWMGPPVRVAFW